MVTKAMKEQGRKSGFKSLATGKWIPKDVSNYSPQVREEVKRLRAEEKAYLESMSGECVTYNIKDLQTV